MEINKCIYPIFVIDSDSRPLVFCGTAFPIVPNGGMITCRHNVDRKLDSSHKLALRDDVNDRFIPLGDFKSLNGDDFDLAFFQDAIPGKTEYFPVLMPSKVLIAEDASTIGKYAIGGIVTNVDKGYFRGHIVNIFRNPDKNNKWTEILPYPVIEGLSGAPVYTYHHGHKLIGICYGSVSQRILAVEITEVKEGGETYKETTNRIVEFGLAYHASEVVNFLKGISVGNYVVSDGNTNVPGLD